MGTVPLPYHAVFDILSRTPLKSVCRFRCVSKGWRDLICSPVFAAAHRSRHGPLLVDAGAYEDEEPDEGRDMRLMGMDGNVVRVIKGVGGYGMMCNTSLDDLICVNGASCGGVNVVDPAAGKVLVSCPHMEVRESDTFPYAATRYYITFGFGRAIPSGEYKLIRLVADQTWEIFTLGDGRGWKKMQPSPAKICYKRGSPVVIDGVMHVFQDKGLYNEDTLLCFDLESEQWKEDVIQGPLKAIGNKDMWRATKGIRLTELNGALCLVHSVFSETSSKVEPPDPFTNIWILVSSVKKTWINAYTITMPPPACRYMPLRILGDGGKLLLQCSFDHGESVELQIYDPRTDTCTDIMETPDDLAGRIGLCSFRLDHSVSSRNFLALFLDQALSFFSN